MHAVRCLDDAGWSTLAKSPVGHVPIRFVCAHALWDSWVHERDSKVPLGPPFTVEPDEVALGLRYIASLGPAFGMGPGRSYRGLFAVEATDPAVSFVEVDSTVRVQRGATSGIPVLRGSAVDLVEAPTSRLPLPASAPPEWRRHKGLLETWNLTLVT